MRATGIIRKIDGLGRLVLPKELRREMDFNIKDPIEIFVKDDNIVVRKYQHACALCDNTEKTIKYNSKMICHDCIDTLNKV